MSITDELREYTEKQIKWLDMTKVHYRKLFSIADRIDAEHQKAIRELNNLADASVLLPVDADGVPIRIGDVMENLRKDLEPQLHHRFKVYSIQYRDYEQACTLTEDGYPLILYRANDCRHYHKPTVEDVLEEMVIEWDCAEDGEDKAAVLEEYAAKLRLAGETE